MPPVAYNPHIIVHSLVSSMPFSSSASAFMFQLGSSANMRSSSKSKSLICGWRESFYQRDQLAKRIHELPVCIPSSSLGICRSVLHAPLLYIFLREHHPQSCHCWPRMTFQCFIILGGRRGSSLLWISFDGESGFCRTSRRCQSVGLLLMSMCCFASRMLRIACPTWLRSVEIYDPSRPLGR
jgi:hypothetical protein